jgi:reverse gyrase
MAMLYDLFCPNCGDEIEDVWIENGNFPICEKCGMVMTAAIRCKSFELKYDPKKDCCSWGNEGYSSSMYWSKVKEARDRGEKVKGANEQ